MNDWSVPLKKIVRGIIVEDIAIYGAGFSIALLADVIHNVFHCIGLIRDFKDISLGVGQIVVAGILCLLLVRKIAQLKYWSNDYSESRQDS